MQTSLPHFVLMKYIRAPSEHSLAYALVIVLRRNNQNGIPVLIDVIDRHLVLHE
jgi:hypothetical protein